MTEILVDALNDVQVGDLLIVQAPDLDKEEVGEFEGKLREALPEGVSLVVTNFEVQVTAFNFAEGKEDRREDHDE